MPGTMKEPRELALAPSGLSFQYFREALAAIWDNHRELPYAWQVLQHGVCDGCAIGSRGLEDGGLGGVHVCARRL